MTNVLTVISGLLFIFFLGCCVTNYAVLYICITKKRNSSLILLFGGVSGAIAILLWPLHPIRCYAWIPLVVDPGFIVGILGLPYLFSQIKQNRKD